MKKCFFFLSLSLIITSNLLTGNNVVIQNFNEKYGLPKNIVNCMCVFQDSKGFMWFGMANGLYKFDLNSFTYCSLQKNNNKGFPEADVRAILEYAPGILLVGTYNKGLLVYNTLIEKYDTVDCRANIDFSKLYVHCIFLDKTGVIWVGTFNGLFRLKPLKSKENKFELLEKFDKTNTNLISSEFVGILDSGTDNIWFLTLSEVCSYNRSSGTFKTIPTYGANSSFTFVDEKRIIIGRFDSGLRILDTKTRKVNDLYIKGISENYRVRYVYMDSQSNIWLSVSNVGLILIESGIENPKLTMISNKDRNYSNLNSNVIYQIGESRDGALWICNEEGVNMIELKKNYFESYSCSFPVKGNPMILGIRALLNSEKGFVWTGTIGGGLKKFDLTSKNFTDMQWDGLGNPIGKNVQAILRDHIGNLWLGTEGDGVIKISADKKSNVEKGKLINYRIYPRSFPVKSLLNDFVMCLLEDRHKNIWIGTWHGLSLIESAEVEKQDQSKAKIINFLHNPMDNKSISNNTIMSLLEDETGNIWVGTQEGLNKIIKSDTGYTFEHSFKSSNGFLLSERKILVIYQSRKGTLWFSTQDGGISSFDVKSGISTDYNSDNGFDDNIVNSINEDDNGNLWLGTNNGLCRFDPSSHSFKVFTTEDGLATENFFFASNCKVSGDLYFGSNNGITVFNPKTIVSSSFKPNLVFTDFRLFNKQVIIKNKNSPLYKHISYVNSVQLKYNQNYITIAFSALNYKQNKEIRYSCKMEGFDGFWNNLGSEHKVTYNNLMPGTYVFKAKAYTSNNYTNSADISLKIAIDPPIWKTTWAYLLYLALLIFILIQTYRYIVLKEKQKNALALERMNAKRIHEMDMMKLQFFTNVSHEFRTPLTLLSAPLETLMKENPEPHKAQTYYQMMYRNIQRLTRLIDQLLDLRKIEEGHLKMEWYEGDIIEFIQKIFNTFQNYADKRKIYFTFQSNCLQVLTYFDADKLDKVLFNLLSNAFKYTPNNGSISLIIDMKSPSDMPYPGLKDNFLEIKISDSGIGIPAESISQLFHPFQQVNTNKPIGSSATGIGLSLTKELVDLHKGYISVESEVNKGSIFKVFLPVFKTLPQNENVKQNNFNDVKNASFAEAAEYDLTHQTNETATGSKPLLLIVEDNSDVRTFLRYELNNTYRIIESSSGEEGFDLAVKMIPDLIISDIMMNKMDGVELCKKLKGDEHTSHIPIILLTARHSEDVKLMSYEIGADEFITKPFNISLLISRIKNLIEQRRKLRMLFGKGNNYDFSSIATNKVDSQFIEKLNKIIEKNIANSKFDPTLLASEMAMSRMQLYRKVTALTNQTVYNYIRTMRLHKAAHLLISTNMQIAEIALTVGYLEPSNFTKCFIRQFNQTPSQFSRTNRK
jgi:signal transduction histidine kinase/ligand-binding sensor domain-containing protein/DNA-binding response OmpR family regulator